ncbi:MAG TPA: tetraacyldisaccharide 4'-kinase [Pyrinomonadaceae bacterium]|nr:tetraacyldisaccharide 4'-kinase [Pyrinomonadaceae bacterium]
MSTTTALVVSPLSALYSLVTRARLAAYRRKLLAVTELDLPVISVGNLTTGGTGKTPLVEWACQVLAAQGRKVCVLTRGYGRADSSSQIVVSDGDQILDDVSATGDEPLLLAKNLSGIAAVVCNPNRVAAAHWAIDNFGSNTFVLDDGFQHLQLARNLNILTIDAANPWGGGMLPYGHLREPINGMRRADCIVLTRTGAQINTAATVETIRRFAPTVPIFTSQMVTSGVRAMNGQITEPPAASEPVAALCAIGNPASFFEQVRRAGYSLVRERAFRDHYYYQQSDIDHFVADAKRSGAMSIFTTAKDAVKLTALTFDLPCYVLEIKIAIDNEADFMKLFTQLARSN